MTLRDGARKSLWQETTTPIIPRDQPDHDSVYDVIIVGAGITGVTLGLLLQKSGKRCLILEAQNIGFGTTGGSTAHLNTLMDTPYPTLIKNFGAENAKHVADATRKALALFHEHITTYNIDCGYQEVPAFLFAQDEKQAQELTEIHEACASVGVETFFVDELPIPVMAQKILRIERQGKLHPLRYVMSLADEFRKVNGIVVENCRVLDDSAGHDPSIVEVHTTSGIFRGGSLVYATHIPIGVNLLHLRCAAYRSYAMAVKLQRGNYPEGLVYDMYDPYHYYRSQIIDGENYLIVGGEDHRTGEETNTNGCFLNLESHVRSHFDVAEVNAKWSSQYFEPADGLPYIGRLPGNASNIFVATGFGGNGITYSHVAAALLKDILLGQANDLEHLFRPGRVKPVAGFTEFVKHNSEVVKSFVGRWLGQEKLSELSGLAHGDGAVVKYENETMAIYKDEYGDVYAVNPTCTHLKCSVAWNAAEKSWDCPCHGARYSFTGEVLTGPASKPLEPIEIRTIEGEGYIAPAV